MNFPIWLTPIKVVEQRYVQSGYFYALAVGSKVTGEVLDKTREAFAACEADYVRKGYRTLPLEDFVRLEEGLNVQHPLRAALSKGERARLYAWESVSVDLKKVDEERSSERKKWGKDLDDILQKMR